MTRRTHTTETETMHWTEIGLTRPHLTRSDIHPEESAETYMYQAADHAMALEEAGELYRASLAWRSAAHWARKGRTLTNRDAVVLDFMARERKAYQAWIASGKPSGMAR